MGMRVPVSLTVIFLVFAGAYAGGIAAWAHLDSSAAKSRFDTLVAAHQPGRALGHGERWLALRTKEGAGELEIATDEETLAGAYSDAKKPKRAAALYARALAAAKARGAPEMETAKLAEAEAREDIARGDISKAALAYIAFLDASGDAAVNSEEAGASKMQIWYVGALDRAAPLFAEALGPLDKGAFVTGEVGAKTGIARHLARLGGFYANRTGGAHAAAGLLSASYEIRKAALGLDAPDTIHSILLLGPVYMTLGRFDDAERIYREALSTEEQRVGSNSPELSLYLRLLAGVYEKTGQYTLAEALYEHVRGVFKDAFGARRYAANRDHDRTADFNRPVSTAFPLPSDYEANDLVSASEYGVPLAKPDGLAEMEVRLAADPMPADAAAERLADRSRTLPNRLAALMNSCQQATGETLSLRSGYRSYGTQKDLYARSIHGQVTPPGASEHQLGLAVDIDVDGRFMRASDRAYRCFEETAFQYGFILSYPQGNDYLPGADTFEPWHWRYVTPQTARLYREMGPLDRPMEFLAALPCYESRAAEGLWPSAGEPDVCLQTPSDAKAVASAAGGNGDGKPARPGLRDGAGAIVNDATTNKTR